MALEVDGNQFLGEIGIASFNFPPKGWAQCNGQLLPIAQNQALFSLLGTVYGGNGQTTFGLPDLRSRVPMHMGQGHTLGERAGQESHVVTIQETPQHVHLLQATQSAGATPTLNGNFLGQASGGIYGAPSNLTSILPSTITSIGGSQAHTNLQPYLVLNFCICLAGVFPSQT